MKQFYFTFGFDTFALFFSYVQLNKASTKEVCGKFGVPNNMDSLLLFQEDVERPAARLSMEDLPYSTLKDIIETNKYLQLPRLSSQVKNHQKSFKTAEKDHFWQ